MKKPQQQDNDWPAKLRALRLRLGLTQKEAAEKVCVTRRTWIYWEVGDKLPPRPQQLLIRMLDAGLMPSESDIAMFEGSR